MKKRISICLNDDTILRIKQYAKNQHLSVSSAIEFLIWNKKMKDDEVIYCDNSENRGS